MKTLEDKILQAINTPNGDNPSGLVRQLADLLEHREKIQKGLSPLRGAHTRDCRRFVSRLQKHIDNLDS